MELNEGEGIQRIPTESEFRSLNESIIKKNPALGLIDERVIYNKEFLLEVQNAGYNPLDKEDVKNYLEQLPPKSADRNMILCGAHLYTELGMSKCSENDIEEFLTRKNIESNIRKTDDVYLSDFNSKNSKTLLTEQESERHKLNMDEYHSDPTFVPSNPQPTGSFGAIEERYRKHLSEVFGAKDASVSKPLKTFVEESESKSVIKHDDRAEKLLTLIKELRALGFSPEEIKQEINNLNR